jgi:hypothetical protein
MNDTDLDLLLALADGRLSAADAAAARTRIAADPHLAAELEMQRLAVDRLHDPPMPTLDTAERERLHASLREHLHLEPIVVPVPVTRPRRRSWWLPAMGLATAAVVLAGVLYVVPRVGDRSTADNVAGVATLDSTRDSTRDSTQAGGSTGEGDVSSPSPTTGAAEPDDGASPQSTDDPTAATTPTTEAGATGAPLEAEASSPDPEPAPADAPESGDADDPTEVTGADPIVVVDLGAEVPSADEIVDLLDTSNDDPQSIIDAYAGTSAPTANVDTAQMAACAGALESAGGGRDPVPIATGTSNGREVVVVGFSATADSPATMSVIALDGCQIVSSATAGS